MFLSAEEPVRSLRIQDFENDKLILVGGENHKTGQEKIHQFIENLQNFAEQTFQVDSTF